MMNNTSIELQEDLKVLVESFINLKAEAKGLYNLYWKGSVGTDIAGLAVGDPASIIGELTKADISSSLVLAEQIDKFFTNQVVAQSDYMASIQNIIHGEAVLATKLSYDVEDFAERAVQFAKDVLELYKQSKNLIGIYNSSELGLAVTAISSHIVVFGCDLTKDQMSSMITLIEQITNFVENLAVTQGDYQATLYKWSSI